MKVTHLGLSQHGYPYQYRIDIPRDNLTKLEEVYDWVVETGLRCCLLPGIVYVPDLKDATLFILRWS
jgi:hypothetical protein